MCEKEMTKILISSAYRIFFSFQNKNESNLFAKKQEILLLNRKYCAINAVSSIVYHSFIFLFILILFRLPNSSTATNNKVFPNAIWIGRALNETWFPSKFKFYVKILCFPSQSLFSIAYIRFEFVFFI